MRTTQESPKKENFGKKEKTMLIKQSFANQWY